MVFLSLLIVALISNLIGVGYYVARCFSCFFISADEIQKHGKAFRLPAASKAVCSLRVMLLYVRFAHVCVTLRGVEPRFKA